jgi:hypothetical protein
MLLSFIHQASCIFVLIHFLGIYISSSIVLASIYGILLSLSDFKGVPSLF